MRFRRVNAKMLSNSKQKLFVKFYDWAHDCLEEVREFALLPSGRIVVLTGTPEAFWFNRNGRNPKSELVMARAQGEKR